MAEKLGMDRKKVNQVMEMAKNYGIIENGELRGDVKKAREIINDNGGTGIIEKALTATNNPLVKMGLRKIGISDDIINSAVNEIKSVTGKGELPNCKISDKPVVSNDLTDRLSRLK